MENEGFGNGFFITVNDSNHAKTAYMIIKYRKLEICTGNIGQDFHQQ